jgi:hypothetical protein
MEKGTIDKKFKSLIFTTKYEFFTNTTNLLFK